MTKYEYYKTMQELCMEVSNFKKSDNVTKTIYQNAAEGFETKATNLTVLQAEEPITEEQQKIYDRFYEEVQEKKKLEKW